MLRITCRSILLKWATPKKIFEKHVLSLAYLFPKRIRVNNSHNYNKWFLNIKNDYRTFYLSFEKIVY